jgi:cytochrome P450
MVMTTIDHKEHGFKRRIAAKALTASAMKKMEAGIMKNVRIFCDKMLDDADHVSRKWNSARNMSQWCGWLVNDIMGDITFHRNWSMLTNEENRDVLEVLSRGVGGLNMVCTLP